MFSLSGLLAAAKSRSHQKTNRRSKIGRKKSNKKKTPLLTGCIGTAVRFWERYDSEQIPNAYGFACSLRCCKHPMHSKERCRSFSRGRSDDLIPEDIYKRYTETDSRPLSPDFTRRSISAPRRISSGNANSRRCLTPEPETRQCQFYRKRVLILDLRRVKSVDAIIARQGSRTPGTSLDSTYGDDDGDYHSSSANPDSSCVFHQLSPRNMSMSRSITPKKKKKGGAGRGSRTKERSSSPVVYERSSSPKILEGVS